MATRSLTGNLTGPGNRFLKAFGGPNTQRLSDVKSHSQGANYALQELLSGLGIGQDRVEQEEFNKAIQVAQVADPTTVTAPTGNPEGFGFSDGPVAPPAEDVPEEAGFDSLAPNPEFKQIANPNQRSLSQRLSEGMSAPGMSGNSYAQQFTTGMMGPRMAQEAALAAAGVKRSQQLEDAATKRQHDLTLKGTPGGPNSPTGRPASALQIYNKIQEEQKLNPPTRGPNGVLVDHPNVALLKSLAKEIRYGNFGGYQSPVSVSSGAPVGTPTLNTLLPGQRPEAKRAAKVAEGAGTAEVAKTERVRKNTIASDVFTASVDNLSKALAGVNTGPISGRLPAMTSGQQIADAATSQMLPALKQLFRQAGEGVFTDADQRALMGMVPTREMHPEAAKASIAMIKQIVSIKLESLGAAAGGSGVPTGFTEVE